MIYSTSPPESEQTEYKPDELVTFLVNIPQAKKYKRGTVYITGGLSTLKAGGAILTDSDKVLYDGNAGIHAFFRNINTTMMNKTPLVNIESNVEQISYYNRYAKSYFEVNKDYQNQVLSNADTMELRTGNDSYTQKILYGQNTADNSTGTGLNYFAFAPLICVNSTMTDINNVNCTSFKIQLTLESLGVPLFTSDGSAKPSGLTWKLQDLRIHYILDDADTLKYIEPVTFMKIFEAKREIVSSQSNMNFLPPGLIQSFSATFLDETTTDNENKLATDTLKDIQRVEFTINGSDSYIKFPILNETELILNYISALNPNPKQSNALYSNLTEQGFGCGLYLINPVNMSNSKFSVNIQCGNGRVNNYSMFAFFQCIETF